MPYIKISKYHSTKPANAATSPKRLPISLIPFPTTAAPVYSSTFPLAVFVAAADTVALTGAVYSGVILFPTGAVNCGVISLVSMVEAALGTVVVDFSSGSTEARETWTVVVIGSWALEAVISATTTDDVEAELEIALVPVGRATEKDAGKVKARRSAQVSGSSP